MREEPGSARGKKLSLLDATLLTAGGILGVGIFFNPQAGAQAADSTVSFLALWLFGGAIALAAAFTFAELGATFPRTGGWFVFLREGFGRFPAFLFAWVVLLVVSTGATAAVALFGASQLRVAFPGWLAGGGALGEKALAAVLIVGLTALGLSGVKRAARTQNLCMALKLVVVAALVLAGLVLVGAGDGPSGSGAQPTSGPHLGWFSGLLPVFFSYGGWQMAAYIAPEVERPSRNLPRAIVGGVLLVIVAYTLVNLAYVRAFGVDGLAANPNFAADLAERAFGGSARRLLAAGMAVSAFGWCLVNVVTAPWLYVAMAREGVFFRRLGELHPRRGVPSAALLLQGAIALGYLVLTLDLLVQATVALEWIFHGLVALALLRLRTRELPRPFRSPLYPLAPVVYLVAALVVLTSTVLGAAWLVRVLGLVVLAVGAGAYAWWTRTRR